MTPQLYLEEYSTGAPECLRQLVAEAKGDDLLAPVTVVVPTQGQVEDFSQARVDKAIMDSAYLAQRVQPLPGGKAPARRGLKRVGAGHLYLRGADNQRQLITVNADVVLLDEFDEMKEGVLELAKKRLGSSLLGWLRVASTPRHPETGINELFLSSDGRYYHLPCPHCGLKQRLPQKPDGSPDTEREQSGVVHDLLAFLAEEMTRLHKEKQSEIKGFLTWLAGYLGVNVEDLKNKTRVKEYWKEAVGWEGFLSALEQNRRAIQSTKGLDVSRREPQETISAEFQASVAKLRPVLECIELTDKLIDRIVYKLYGLTEEEIAVVEVRS